MPTWQRLLIDLSIYRFSKENQLINDYREDVIGDRGVARLDAPQRFTARKSVVDGLPSPDTVFQATISRKQYPNRISWWRTTVFAYRIPGKSVVDRIPSLPYLNPPMVADGLKMISAPFRAYIIQFWQIFLFIHDTILGSKNKSKSVNCISYFLAIFTSYFLFSSFENQYSPAGGGGRSRCSRRCGLWLFSWSLIFDRWSRPLTKCGLKDGMTERRLHVVGGLQESSKISRVIFDLCSFLPHWSRPLSECGSSSICQWFGQCSIW